MTIPISADNFEAAAKQIKKAKTAGAEMLELRTDYLDELSVDVVKKLISKVRGRSKKKALPVIVTCRDKKQGGAKSYPLQMRIDVLVGALKAGAEFIDLEYENFTPTENQERIRVALAQSLRGKLILSAHNFKTKFANIARLYHHIEAIYPAAIPKLVYTANHINDCFEAFDLLHSTGGERIVFCMGEAGLISRIIAKKLGSLVTFASMDEDSATAPGQLTIEQFKNLYRYDCINAETELYGVIGSPVAHSLSPAVHNTGFADIGANKLYLPLLVESRPSEERGEGGKAEFERFVNNITNRGWLGFRGFSITIPHKENALDYVKSKGGFVEPLAKKIGAVNTLLISKDGTLKAYNTDYTAVLDAIASAMGKGRSELKGLPVAVVGAGGVARAIVAGLADAGAKVRIYNRTVGKAERLAVEFDCDFASLDDLPNLDAKLVINCTSIGMHPDINETPIPKEIIEQAQRHKGIKDFVVFDTIYNPAETLLLKQAKELGAKTISGLDMFVNQAAEQFKLFTGEKANTDLMRKIISDCLCRQ